MKLGKSELQFILGLANNAKASDIDYFLFDENDILCGYKPSAPQSIVDIFTKYKNIEGEN